MQVVTWIPPAATQAKEQMSSWLKALHLWATGVLWKVKTLITPAATQVKAYGAQGPAPALPLRLHLPSVVSSQTLDYRIHGRDWHCGALLAATFSCGSFKARALDLETEGCRK